jgi:hypothetical protein
MPSNLLSALDTVNITMPLWLPSRIESSTAINVMLCTTFQLDGLNVSSAGPINAIWSDTVTVTITFSSGTNDTSSSTDAVLVESHSSTLRVDGAHTRTSGTTSETHLPEDDTLYKALQAHTQLCMSVLPMKWLYRGSKEASHEKHAASTSVLQSPRYSPTGHVDIVQDVHDSADCQYPLSQVQAQLSASNGCPDVV